ncbi:hypothetical protein ACWDXT_06255 [Streptomyces sp. NPDC003236]
MNGEAGARGAGKDLATGGLGDIAQGLNLALGELNDLGMVGLAGAGRGFTELELSGLDLGHESLTDSFQSFCERWEWGVRSLVNEGNALAVKTGMAAGAYYETEKYIEGSFKIGLNSAIGNPHASEEDVAKQSWGDVATSSLHVDYSEESFEKAYNNSAQGWKDAGRDVMTSRTMGPMGLNPENLHGAMGVSDTEYNKMLDDTFGPSPEERARGAQSGGEG